MALARQCPNCGRPGAPHDTLDDCVKYLGLADLPTTLRLLADYLSTIRRDFPRYSDQEQACSHASISLHALARLLVDSALNPPR